MGKKKTNIRGLASRMSFKINDLQVVAKKNCNIASLMNHQNYSPSKAKRIRLDLDIDCKGKLVCEITLH